MEAEVNICGTCIVQAWWRFLAERMTIYQEVLNIQEEKTDDECEMDVVDYQISETV